MHIDAIGPFTVATNSGYKHALFLTDDCTRHVTTELMATLDLQVERFEKWLIWANTQTDTKLKWVRCDGAWDSLHMRKLETLHGFERKMTARDHPQSNGTAERMGGIISTKARTMLVHSRMPQSFYGEALKPATFTWNHTPIMVNAEKDSISSPNQLFKSEYRCSIITSSPLRPFGCKAFVKVVHANTGKALPRADCLMLRLSMASMAWIQPC